MEIFLPIIFATVITSTAELGKGVGNPWQNHDCVNQQLNVDWWYNWLTVDADQCGGNFIPMVWSVGVGQRLLDGELQLQDSDYVIYLNEPDIIGQANDTPAEAAAMLPLLQAKYPARRWIVGNTLMGAVWLDEFMALCSDCDIYGIGVHYYTWYCDPGVFAAYLDQFDKYNKPLFVTELGCLNYDTGYQITSYGGWLDVMLDTGGYALYSTRNPDGFPAVFDALDLVGTELGEWYAAEPVQ